MTRHGLALVVGTAVGLACGSRANAQTGTVVAPSLAIGGGYDTNVFWLPTTTNMQRADTLWRVTPGLTVRHLDGHNAWGGEYTFDAERYQNHQDLSTALARQSAAVYEHLTASPFTKWNIDGRFDSTLSPSDLNLMTGILIGRVRASRWAGDTSASHDVSPRVALDGDYHVSLDQLDASIFQSTSRVLTNEVEGGLKLRVTARNDLTVKGQTERLDFAVGPAILSTAALGGWAFRITPATTMSITAGPRWSSGRVTPDIDANVTRRQGPSEASVSYARTETTAIGLPGIVDVQRVMASGVYRQAGTFEASVEGGVFDNSQRLLAAVEAFDTRVYHVGAHVTVPIGGVVSLQSTYALDWQKGAVATGVSPALSSLVGGSGTVSRQLIFVQFVVSRPLAPLPKAKQPAGDPNRRP